MTEQEAKAGCKIASCEPILKFVKPNYIGVEIGCFIGTSSKRFLEHCAYMYFADPFKIYPGYKGPENDFVSMDIFLNEMKDYSGRFMLICKTSAEAIGHIPEVDFVYVDGNHDPNFVKQDLELYWPKIRPGGFMSGHDYSWCPGAIHEFFNVPVAVYGDCWYVPKT